MMNVQIDQLVKSLLQKDSLEQCSLQELQQYADRHPYFGAAQLLLTKKLQTEKPDLYEEQLQKTFLFFHNPLWVEHLLNNTGEATIFAAKPAESTPKTEIPVIPETVQTESDPITDIPVTPEPVQTERAERTPAETLASIEEEKIVLAEAAGPGPKIEEQAPRTGSRAFNIPQLKIGPVDPGKAEMLFQPYHTVDYFASQGIKFREEEKPTDKFGQQLKSFTDWLKIMKRLPVTEVTKNIDTRSETKVEKLAEHSIEDREVLTEAMAEVWEKQENPLKAIEIYRKLSLLDPSKSAYFAAKIEDLKKLN